MSTEINDEVASATSVVTLARTGSSPDRAVPSRVEASVSVFSWRAACSAGARRRFAAITARTSRDTARIVIIMIEKRPLAELGTCDDVGLPTRQVDVRDELSDTRGPWRGAVGVGALACIRG